MEMTMSNQAIPEPIRQIFSSVLELDKREVTLELSPQTSGKWDSLKNMELIIAVESHFGIKFGAADIARLDSVKGYCDALSQEKYRAMA
jgi:acyl carrier protein